MKNDFQNYLIQKLDDIYSVEPTYLGSRRLTSLYKMVTGRFKIMPFIYLVPFSFLLAVVAYIALGGLLIKLVTLLQHGF